MEYKTNETIEYLKNEGADTCNLFTNNASSCFVSQNNICKNGSFYSEIDIKTSKKHKIYHFTFHFSDIKDDNRIEHKNFIKRSLYLALSKFLLVKQDWGAITGIHPSLLIRKLLAKGKTNKEIKQILKNEYLISNKKIKLLFNIIKNQGELNNNNKNIGLYINIPFCPSRCSYCSFLAQEIGTKKTEISDYLKYLFKDIISSLEIIKKGNFNVTCVYVGGGTPTTLNATQLTDMLKLIQDLSPKEITVEAGRPDTIDEDKLTALANNKVTRICINPQTFCDKTLKIIGRWHTSQQTINAYKLARKYPFLINMDLIAGLPSEDLQIFKNTLKTCISLSPDNITVHTLSLKKGSKLEETNNSYSNHSTSMIDIARRKLVRAGYIPYYLYKQKNMMNNEENTGYCKQNSSCLFNIYTMEECASILSCGAGSISKKVNFENGKIERFAEPKDISLYYERFNENQKKKSDFFLENN
ncbi:MAG: coproporphyrinogen dehydrogenase HemZ [Clostridia bacterium]